MSQQHRRLQSEVPPHLVEVVEVGGERDVFGLHMRGGVPAPALVVVDQPKCILQAIEFGKQIVMIEIRSAVEHDDGSSLTDGSNVKRRVADGDAAFHRLHVAWYLLRGGRV